VSVYVRPDEFARNVKGMALNLGNENEGNVIFSSDTAIPQLKENCQNLLTLKCPKMAKSGRFHIYRSWNKSL